MKSSVPIILNIILLFLSACSSPSGDTAADRAASIQFSTNYSPPVFKDQDRLQKISLALSESHHFYQESSETNHLPGIAYGVVVDDSLVFFGGFGATSLESGTAITEHSLFRIASMTKSFTAMAILKLRDEGKLSLWEPASVYVPELNQLSYLSSDASPITLYELLTMTAGFPEDNPWGDRFLDISDEELMKLVREGISSSNAPSVQYEYSNLGFGLLGHIISSVSGLSYQEYITRYILHPLGMNHTYWEYSSVPADLLALGYRWEDEQWQEVPLLHDGAFGAMGGLITSISDFSKYISFHLSAWPPKSDPEAGPVKRSTLREMHRMNNPRFYVDQQRFGENSSPIMRGYGFGLVSMKDHEGVVEVGHNGGLPGFGSSYMFYPQHGIGIMAFSNLTYVGGTVRTTNYKVMKELINKDLFSPRELPVSHILAERMKQVIELLLNWDRELEDEILAANFYMDLSREKRMAEASQLLDQLGEIVSTGALIPENQLRGSFLLFGKEQQLQVYFTLTPEADPRVQWLTLELIP